MRSKEGKRESPHRRRRALTPRGREESFLRTGRVARLGAVRPGGESALLPRRCHALHQHTRQKERKKETAKDDGRAAIESTPPRPPPLTCCPYSFPPPPAFRLVSPRQVEGGARGGGDSSGESGAGRRRLAIGRGGESHSACAWEGGWVPWACCLLHAHHHHDDRRSKIFLSATAGWRGESNPSLFLSLSLPPASFPPSLPHWEKQKSPCPLLLLQRALCLLQGLLLLPLSRRREKAAASH